MVKKRAKNESKLVRISTKVHRKLRRFAFFKNLKMMNIVDESVLDFLTKKEKKR